MAKLQTQTSAVRLREHTITTRRKKKSKPKRKTEPILTLSCVYVHTNTRIHTYTHSNYITKRHDVRTLFGPRLPGPVDGHFDGFRVRRHLMRERADGDGQREGLPSSAPAHESQIVEFGNLVLHDGRAISQFGHRIFVVAGFDRDQSPVLDVV